MGKRNNWLKNDKEAEEAKRTMALDVKMASAIDECEAKTSRDFSNGAIDKDERDILMKVLTELRGLLQEPHSYDNDGSGEKAVEALITQAHMEVNNMAKVKANEEIGLAEE